MSIKENLKRKEEFGRFFIEYYPKVKAFAEKILMSKQDAEDVAQDIFLILLDKPDIWGDKERRNSYLFKMAKNHIFNFIKHKNIEYKYQQELAQEKQLADEFGIDDKLHAKETELIIMYAVEQMPERRKNIFKMSRYERKTNIQISELLNMSVRTVERHLYLALSDLKKILSFYLSD
ncbi:ECF RNA polymerase sigma factor SigL [termite gut metagenome]|uniref:ECF RNA polymerase sigma factor SigL n=1 Tax=termite gut metagenome TaxID=433724 RepID=A0A5J4STV2_9ZZZZ